MKPLQKDLANRKSVREKSSTTLAKVEADTEKEKANLLELERTLSSSQQKSNAISAAIREQEEAVLVGREKIRSLEHQAGLFEKDKIELQKRTAKLEEQRDAMRGTLDSLGEEVNAAETEYQQARGRYEQRKAGVDALKEELRVHEEAHLQALDALSEKRALHSRDTAQLKEIEARQRTLGEESGALAAQRSTLDAKLRARLSETSALENQLRDIQSKHKEVRHQLEQLRVEIEMLSKESLQRKGQRESLRDRTELLNRLIETHEDRPESVRTLLTEPPQDFTSSGTLADNLTVDNKYRRAIEASLGDLANYLIVSDKKMAFRGIGMLRRTARGTAAFIPVNTLRTPSAVTPSAEIEAATHFLGWAHQLVRCDAHLTPLVTSLLQRVAVFEDGELSETTAELAGRQHIDIVTLNGELYYSHGAIRGGAISHDNVGLLGRKEKLSELRTQISELEKNITKGEKDRAEKETQREALSREETQIAQDLEVLETTVNANRVENARLEFQLSSLTKREEHIAQEREELERRTEEIAKNLTDLKVEMEELERAKASRASQSPQKQSDLHKAEVELEKLTQETEKVHIELVSKRSEYENLNNDITRTEELLGETAERIATREKELEDAKNEAEAQKKTIEQLKTQLQKDFNEREAIEKVLHDLEEQHRGQKSAIDEQERHARDLRNVRESEADTIHDYELKVNELLLKSQNLRDRIREEHDISLEEGEIDEEFDFETTEGEIEVLRQKLKSIGPVNLLALKEFEQEKKRLDLLVDQRQDLLDARANLEETIQKINETARNLFVSVFDKIKDNFSVVFNEFFEHGKAELALEMGTDPLEAEIKIGVNPKGRRMESLSLLSGGEKALTAISLLFAIYLVKPSPFCILDEVDAPLDDINVDRFIQALRKFSDNTQFIIVTHNKLSMKAADYLYGVTMEEDGVSKLVSVRFGDEGARTGETPKLETRDKEKEESGNVL